MGKWVQISIGELFDRTFPGEWGTEPTSFHQVPVIGTKNFMDNGKIDFSNVSYRKIPAEKLSRIRLAKGDILIEKSGGSTDKFAGRVVIINAEFDGVCSNFVEGCKVKNDLNSEFVFFLLFHLYLTGRVQKYQQQTTGIINFKLKEYKKEKVEIPDSTAEQSAIAKLLSTIDQAIEKAEQLIAKYERIKTGLMQDLLTRGIDENGNIRSEETHEFKDSVLGRIPKEWEEGIVKDFLSYISYGFTNPMATTEQGPFMITAANIFGGRIQYGSCRFTSQKEFNTLLTPKSKPVIGDVLITKDGTLGRMAIADKKNICINQSVAVLRLKSEKVSNIFFKTLLESPKYQKMIMDDSGGSTIKHIYITKLGKMPIAVPKDIDEQKRILDCLTQMQETIESYVHQLGKLRSTKTGLMQDLLTGKVRVDVIN